MGIDSSVKGQMPPRPQFRRGKNHQVSSARFLFGLVVVLLATGGEWLLAQALRGQVLMPDGGNPNRQLRLVLDDREGMRTHEILYTDSNGRFTFISLPNGNYRITIDADASDFETTIQDIRVDPANRYVVIMLKATRGEELTVGTLDASIPDKAKKAYQKAVSHLRKDQTNRAEAKLREAISLHAAFFEARNDLGMLYVQEQRYQEAEGELNVASELRPDDFRPRYNLGVTLVNLQRFGEAVVQLRQVVHDQPELADAHFYLGVASYGLESLDAAQVHLKKAYTLDPEKEVEALMFLGNVYYLKGNLEEAVKAFQKYLQVLPDAPNAAQVRQAIANIEKEKNQP